MKVGFLLVMILICISCSNDDKVSLNVEQPDIFAHYDISAEEGSTMTTCLVRYYKNRTRKITLKPEEMGKVELDGVEIPVDSSRLSGVFYETRIPVSGFEGKHIITVTSKNNHRYEEIFSFVPITLLTELGEAVPKSGVVLELQGLQPEDKVRLVMLDTAFESHGVNQVETVKNGQLLIDDNLLKTLKSGPVIMEISKESEWPLTSGLDGIFTYTYVIRRSFILKD